MSCSGPLASVSNNSKSETELFPLVTSQGTTRFLDAKQAGPFDDPSRAESQLHEDSIMAAWSHLFEYVPVKIILGCVVCRFAQGPP